MKERKTTVEGWVFIGSWLLIIAAAVLYGISEYTVDPELGQAQENWAIGLFSCGAGGLLLGKVFGK